MQSVAFTNLRVMLYNKGIDISYQLSDHAAHQLY